MLAILGEIIAPLFLHTMATCVCRKNERRCRSSRRFFKTQSASPGSAEFGTEFDDTTAMNKPMKYTARSQFTLGELILAVSSCSRNSREATLAVLDLLQSRRVVLRQRNSRARH